MTEEQFLDHCERVLRAIEDGVERAESDIDASRNGGVLELEFEDGSAIIVNGNAPVREIWVAARSGGFHFRHDGQSWRDTRSGGELFESLSKLVSAQSGETVVLRQA